MLNDNKNTLLVKFIAAAAAAAGSLQQAVNCKMQWTKGQL
jgi:hypothetical protein